MINKFIFIFITLFFPSFIYSQFSYQFDSELGFFSSTESILSYKNDFLYNFHAEIKYTYEMENRIASAYFIARPEILAKNKFSALKLKASGSYFQKEKNFNWGFDLTKQRYNYSANSFDIYYDIIYLSGSLNLFFIDEFPLLLNSGYTNQTISNEINRHINIAFLDFKIQKKLWANINSSFGIYFEKFFAENSQTIQQINPGAFNENKNEGERFGPQVSLNYLHNFILSLNYRFLFHYSKFTKNKSYEQSLRLVAGKIFSGDISAFLLVDYSARHFRLKEGVTVGLNPLYSSLNLENRIYLKLGYDLNDFAEIYIKSGYTNENIAERKYSYSGWNILTGIEISN